MNRNAETNNSSKDGLFQTRYFVSISIFISRL